MANFNEIGTPTGNTYVYVINGKDHFLIGGYDKPDAVNLKRRLQLEGKKVIISHNPSLGDHHPHSGHLATQSAIKRITLFEKNIGSKMMRRARKAIYKMDD